MLAQVERKMIMRRPWTLPLSFPVVLGYFAVPGMEFK